MMSSLSLIPYCLSVLLVYFLSNNTNSTESDMFFIIIHFDSVLARDEGGSFFSGIGLINEFFRPMAIIGLIFNNYEAIKNFLIGLTDQPIRPTV